MNRKINNFPVTPGRKHENEHHLLNELLTELEGVAREYHTPQIKDLEASLIWRKVIEGGPGYGGKILLAAMEQEVWHIKSSESTRAYPLSSIIQLLIKNKLELDEPDVLSFIMWLTETVKYCHHWVPVSQALSSLIRWHNEIKSPLIRQAIVELSDWVVTTPHDEVINSRVILREALGLPAELTIRRHEIWAESLHQDFHSFSPENQKKWLEVFNLCAAADGSTPSAKWLKKFESLMGEKGVPLKEFQLYCLKWIPLVNQPAPGDGIGNSYGAGKHPLRISNFNQDVLKGIVWASTLAQDADLGRAVAGLAISCYNKKIPGEGPRAPRVGNACVWALGQYEGMQSVAYLSYMKVRVRYGTAQKQIEKALNARAERMGMSRDDLEEMGVSDYGLTAVGEALIPLGDCQAVIKIESTSKVTLSWVNNKGKAQQSVPAELKDSFKDELKEIKGSVADILKMLPAQRDRIDNLFLQQKVWAYSNWRERYCDHPLVGTLARRLIWELHQGDVVIAFVPHDGRLIQLDGSEITTPGAESQVKMWHPINAKTGDVLAWRDRLAALNVIQPFKQAHREVYLLTDAERKTEVYSNRFAAHVIRQHQFNALCGARGWKNKLRLMVDSEYPPAYKELPQFGIRVEYWIEGIGNDYGTDTNDSGTFLYLATDQVRYYRLGAQMSHAHASGGGYHVGRFVQQQERETEPMKLEEVPGLVLSETMRDIDLFVGVGSIGNDPSWMDGGRAETHNEYWSNYSFGALSESAKSRKAVLEKIISRLKIASRCSFDDRFLRVKGDIREYKIHLGSGNIQMEPNNQYLCIVAKQSASKAGDKIMLPFEGDGTTSIILSKAFMLAEDKKITDPSIISQITLK
jgi:Domain of unknown function (DUF4132)